jgi:hypothetical protein
LGLLEHVHVISIECQMTCNAIDPQTTIYLRQMDAHSQLRAKATAHQCCKVWLLL